MFPAFLRSAVAQTLPILVVGLLSISGCSKDKAADELPARTVRAAVVTAGDLVDQVELIGELEGIREVRIFAEIPERIRKLAVKEGDSVRAGELLVTLWSDMQSEGVRQAEAGLDAALAQRDGVADNLRRTRVLAEAGATSPSQLEALEAQARGAEAQVRQGRAALALAAAQRDRLLIKSPVDGLVAQVRMREGDLAAPGVPLMSVVDATELKAILRVPEREFLRVESGMPVHIAALARPDLVRTGAVTLRGPVVDRMTRTGLVEVHLDNPGDELLAGSAIRAIIELGRRKDVILVPAEAVLFTVETRSTGNAVAFIEMDGKAHRREVQVGVRQGDTLEIRNGVAVGENLIVQGAAFLHDGGRVTILDPKQDERL